jgi:hypothetical protein
LNGTLSGALVPGAGLFAFDALPSFGLLGGNRKFDWGVGGFAPVALGFVSYSPLALTTASYNAGLGGIGIFNADLGRATLSGGAVVEGRYSDPGRGHLPLNALVQVTYPVSIIDAVGSVAVANDPLYPHTFGSAIRLGAGWGDWQFGYQLFVTSGYVGHQLGFLHRQKLRRSELLERPQAPPPQPTSSPPPAVPASSPESSTQDSSKPEAADVETAKPESTDPAPAELESPDTEPADTTTVPSASDASGEPSTAETKEGSPPELRPADDTMPADGAIE